KYPVLSHGSLKFLYGSYNCLAYGRFSHQCKMVILFNNNAESHEMTVPVWQTGASNSQVMKRVFFTDSEGYSEESAVYPITVGEIRILMPGTSSAVLVAADITKPSCEEKKKAEADS
ncbi:MAG: hypothetical protein SOX32_01300, partial [Candidatus Choladocola sp.]|nr:hypothetical protein [Candidatus Choladocola sp.]